MAAKRNIIKEGFQSKIFDSKQIVCQCTGNRMLVNNPILRDYFQFTGIIRDVDMESDIGPMWRENTPNGI